MNILRYFILSLAAFFSVTMTNAAPDQKIQPIKPAMYDYFEITTEDLTFENKAYRLFIAAPKHGSAPLSVLYLLDANAQFPLAVNAVKTDRTLPLIIGIGYTGEQAYFVSQRTRDYTFPANSAAFSAGGGAADFLRFIRSNVIPHIETRYPIAARQRYFFGHSFGGLFGLYLLFNQPALFDHYILASPSLWWGDGAFLPQQTPWITPPPASILITLGEYEATPAADPKMSAERLDKITRRRQIFTAEQLSEQLRRQGYVVEFALIARQDHGGSIPYAIARAIAQLQENK